MASKPEIERFQVEVIKHGNQDTVELLITTIRGLRGRRKLFGQALTRTVHHPVIEFKVQHAKDLDDLRDRFLKQLIHRGYKPLRYRARVEGYYQDWEVVDPEKYDMEELRRLKQPTDFVE